MTLRRGLLALVVALLVVGAVVVGALALGGPDPQAHPSQSAVENRTMSPFCPGLTLSECPSTQASVLRAKIGELVAQHQTNKQIDDWLRSQYGDTISGTPKSPLARLIPAIAVVLGIGVVGIMIVRRSGRSGRHHPEPVDETAPLSSAERRRLLADLQKFAEGSTE